MHRISDTLTQVTTRIHEAAASANRNADEITLLGVSKKQSAEKIAELYELGVKNIGENYLQEALAKQEQLAQLDICWHFIGPIQSNKAATIAQHFDWVHSVDRLKVAQKLAQARPKSMLPLNVCIQVNVDAEDSKSGVAPEELETLAGEILAMPQLRLRGLMVIPRPNENTVEQRIPFARAREFKQLLAKKHDIELDTLSMGMSGDLNAAIMEGATVIRIGTALFGRR